MMMRTNSYSLSSFSLLLLLSSFCLHQGTAAAVQPLQQQQTSSSSASQSLRAAAAASAVDGNDNGDDNGNEESRKIVGGEKVKWGEAPWQVAIFERDDAHDKFCGGALIGPRTVLTAAHCIDKGEENYPHHFVVRYGTLDFTKGSDLFVGRVNRHPGYNPATGENDIATLILKASFAEGDNARVIQLPTVEGNNDTSSFPPVGTVLELTGWGHLQAGDGQLSTSLQRASGLVVMEGEECRKRWAAADPPVTIDPARVICAEDPVKSACFGDMGGAVVMRTRRKGVMTDGDGDDGQGSSPLEDTEDEEILQVGVISFGSAKCTSSGGGSSGTPNVYTRVAAYADWIRANSGARSALVHSSAMSVFFFVFFFFVFSVLLFTARL